MIFLTQEIYQRQILPTEILIKNALRNIKHFLSLITYAFISRYEKQKEFFECQRPTN